jgi:gamma-glutamyl hydrolase
MFSDLGDEAFKFETEEMTLNSHSYGVDPAKYLTDKGLASMYKLTSISYEPEEPFRPFAATVEGRKYPFMATQFHPEKTTAMFNDNEGVNHSWLSINMNRYFADKFMTMAR